MIREFRAFLIKENILALAIAVVIGAAFSKVVAAVVDDFIMPIVGAVSPAGDWRAWTWSVGSVTFGIGHFVGALIDFLIIGFVVWRISKAFIKPAVASSAPATKLCQFCRMNVDVAASRCAHCTSEL
ncbi:MAG: MscL family protein [Anaerolineae bacterium]|nr:MscL family protein [Gemmatimonadaceae bacterium]